MMNMTLKEFAEKHLDGLYDPRVPEDHQGSGYRLLKTMIVEQIEPATEDECDRWEHYPTSEELIATPPLKYLRFLHPSLRPAIRTNWNYIKTLSIESMYYRRGLMLLHGNPDKRNGELIAEFFDEKILEKLIKALNKYC